MDIKERLKRHNALLARGWILTSTPIYKKPSKLYPDITWVIDMDTGLGWAEDRHGRRVDATISIDWERMVK